MRVRPGPQIAAHPVLIIRLQPNLWLRIRDSPYLTTKQGYVIEVLQLITSIQLSLLTYLLCPIDEALFFIVTSINSIIPIYIGLVSGPPL